MDQLDVTLLLTNGSLIFNIGGHEALRLDPDGKAFVCGEFVVTDADVIGKIRNKLLEHLTVAEDQGTNSGN